MKNFKILVELPKGDMETWSEQMLLKKNKTNKQKKNSAYSCIGLQETFNL